MVSFENESYKSYVNFLHDLLKNSPEEKNVEAELVSVCEKVLQMYLECSSNGFEYNARHCILPLGSAKKEELEARTPLVVSVMRILGGLERDCFRRHVSHLFPLLVDLVRSEHTSLELQRLLSNIFQSCIGPMVIM